MIDDSWEMVYDPTRRFSNLYNSYVGAGLLVTSAITTVVFTIATLAVTLGDHNYIAGGINFIFWLISVIYLSGVLHYTGSWARDKIRVYNAYAAMDKSDRNQYKDMIKAIHRDGSIESIDYETMTKLFKEKSKNNAGSVQALRDKLKNDLEEIDRMKKISAEADKILDDLNKEFKL